MRAIGVIVRGDAAAYEADVDVNVTCFRIAEALNTYYALTHKKK